MKTIISLAASIAIIATATAAANAQDAPAKVVPIQVNGDPATHFSLVILGDGFTASEMNTFRADLEKHLNILWSLEPFRSYRNYINVYAVEITSKESGITCDPAHRGQRKTPLGLYFDGGCTNPNARGILANSEEAKRYARLATRDFDQVLVIANTDTYGGIGGSIATTSGGNSLSPYITPHEIGHSLGKLQDEYTYYQRGVKGAPYTGGEPSSIHHTLMTESEMRAKQAKWWRWLGEPSESGGTIGRYEGGMYSVSGVWRPSKHSMMISLGYYFDQVSRERVAQRISEQVELISASTPTHAPVAKNDVLWIETAHPVYASLATTWFLDGNIIASANGARNLDLATLVLDNTDHTVSVKAVDTTSFVRDAGIRDTSFTATKTWHVRNAMRNTPDTVKAPFITASTLTTRPIGGKDVVYVETDHASGRAYIVSWSIDGNSAVQTSAETAELALSSLNLAPGKHKLQATVQDPFHKQRVARVSWLVDNDLPSVTYELSRDTASVTRLDGSRQYLVHDSFTMKLIPKDDQSGYVVTEFRLDGDGWHHYYGWPDAPPGTPFRFTPRGTPIKELVYGSLSSEGLSPQPWETRTPGYGSHNIEYRARDAAGNVGDVKSFGVMVSPSYHCTDVIFGKHAGDVVVQGGVTCLIDATLQGSVTVQGGGSVLAQRTRISGDLKANDAGVVELIASTVSGSASIHGTRQGVTIFGSRFGANLTLENNHTPTPVIFAGNTVARRLDCDAADAITLSAPSTADAKHAVCRQ